MLLETYGWGESESESGINGMNAIRHSSGIPRAQLAEARNKTS